MDREPIERLMTIEDLAARWQLSVETTWDRVREHNVPAVWVGRGKYSLSRAGPKTVRFRLADIQAWETSQMVAMGYQKAESAPFEQPPVPEPKTPESPSIALPPWDWVNGTKGDDGSMTIKDAAAYLQVSRTLVWSLCREGALKHVRSGTGRGTIYIDQAELDRYRASRERAAKDRIRSKSEPKPERKPQRLLAIALSFEQSGRTAAALGFYQALANDYPKSAEAKTARERLKALEAK